MLQRAHSITKSPESYHVTQEHRATMYHKSTKCYLMPHSDSNSTRCSNEHRVLPGSPNSANRYQAPQSATKCPQSVQSSTRCSKEPGTMKWQELETRVLPGAPRAQGATMHPKEPRVLATRYPKSTKDYLIPHRATSAPMSIGFYQVIQNLLVLPGVPERQECLLPGASKSSNSYFVPQYHSAARYPKSTIMCPK